jgi:type II secretory pathway pseudopilin PulG
MTRRMLALVGVAALILGWWLLDQWSEQLGLRAQALRTETAHTARQQARLATQDWSGQLAVAQAVQAAWRSTLYVGASTAHIRADVASDMHKILTASTLRAASFKVVERTDQAVASQPFGTTSSSAAFSLSEGKPLGTEEIAVVFSGSFTSEAVANLMMLLESGSKAMKVESLVVKGPRFDMTVLFLAAQTESASVLAPAMNLTK